MSLYKSLMVCVMIIVVYASPVLVSKTYNTQRQFRLV